MNTDTVIATLLKSMAYPFCMKVNAQRGKKITDEAADMVIAYADNIIESLLNDLPHGETY